MYNTDRTTVFSINLSVLTPIASTSVDAEKSQVLLTIVASDTFSRVANLSRDTTGRMPRNTPFPMPLVHRVPTPPFASQPPLYHSVVFHCRAALPFTSHHSQRTPLTPYHAQSTSFAAAVRTSTRHLALLLTPSLQVTQTFTR